MEIKGLTEERIGKRVQPWSNSSLSKKLTAVRKRSNDELRPKTPYKSEYERINLARVNEETRKRMMGIGQGRTLNTPGKVRSSSRVLFTNQAFFYSRLETEPECQPVADK